MEWKTDKPNDHLEALIKCSDGYRVAFYLDGQWHDSEQGQGWTYDGVEKYIPTKDLE